MRVLVPSALRRPQIVAPVIIFVALLGWGIFRPDFRPDPNAIAPEVRKELLKLGFRSTSGVRGAKFEIVQSVLGQSENLRSVQKIGAIDALVTEKSSRRRSIGLAEESAGLYVGPITVVRYTRSKPPVLGALLPSEFWSSSRISEFVVEQINGFPTDKGGTVQAKVTYEDRYDGGDLMQIERRRLRCEVGSVTGAATLNPGLTGPAARIDCREEVEPNGRILGPKNPGTWSIGRIEFSHWYILNVGWSIPIRGEQAIGVGDTEEVRKWSTRLISFEAADR